MPVWHNVRVRDDLYRMLQDKAASERRSVASMIDVLLSRALESASERPVQPEAAVASPASTRAPSGEEGRQASPRTAPHGSPASARSSQVEGQTTVDEMLASCPNCAEDLVTSGTNTFCESCGYVREPS